MARDYAKLIGHLIAKAESAQELGNEDEAKAYRLKAENLMREYRISEEETIAQDQFSVLPGRFEVVLMESNAYHNGLRDDYVSLWGEIARHAGVRFQLTFRWKDGVRGRNYEECSLVAVVFGYEMDVRIAEFYWTSARLVFMTRIDARPNPELSDAENCYYLRNSGKPRNEIAKELWGSAMNDGAAHGKVQRLYLAECERRGEAPRVSGRGIQVKLYREAYANAFVSEFGWRLREARDAADSAGGVLTLAGRKERVDEAFYEAYPDRRPMSEEEAAKYRAENEARDAERREEEANCQACAKAKTSCRRHRTTTFTEADYRRWDRKQNGPEAQAGRKNGAAAARSVNISRTAGERTQRAEAPAKRPELS